MSGFHDGLWLHRDTFMRTGLFSRRAAKRAAA